jgi:DnaJ like chaperone protein
MNWTGKIVGALLGLLLLGPWGALLGAFIGHQFDGGGALFGAAAAPAQVNALFFPTTFRVMGHIAKADGHVSEQDIASARGVMHALRLAPDQMLAAMGYFNEGKQPGFDLDAALRQLRGAIAPHPELVHFFLEIQLQAALAGDGLAGQPRERLRHVAELLGLGSAEFARLESILRWHRRTAGAQRPGAGDGAAPPRAGAEPLAEAYSVLQADSAMSDEQIVKAYRRQMSRHHPDKLMAQGLPDSMLERAKERTQQIQAAYEAIRAHRGMR